jgi:hypothetical protein
MAYSYTCTDRWIKSKIASKAATTFGFFGLLNSHISLFCLFLGVVLSSLSAFLSILRPLAAWNDLLPSAFEGDLQSFKGAANAFASFYLSN